jgi:hypothetical protein
MVIAVEELFEERSKRETRLGICRKKRKSKDSGADG